MTNKLLTRQEVIEKAKISEKVLKEWETAKLIRPSAITEDETELYTLQVVERIGNIRKFLDMGYDVDGVQKILKKIGLPQNQGTEGDSKTLNKHLTVGGLAEKAAVSPRTIKHWEDKGIIEADMRSEGGFRLYSEIYVYLCNLIKDLQLFGYTLDEIKYISDLFRTFLSIYENIKVYKPGETEERLDKMLEEIGRLNDKMNLFKTGIQRWTELINKKKKEINVLKKRNQKRGQEVKGGQNA